MYAHPSGWVHSQDLVSTSFLVLLGRKWEHSNALQDRSWRTFSYLTSHLGNLHYVGLCCSEQAVQAWDTS